MAYSYISSILMVGLMSACMHAWINGPVQLMVDKQVVHVGQSINISCATDKPIPKYKIYMGSEDPILLEYSNGTETLTGNDIQITVSYINITKTVNNCSDAFFNLTCVVKESYQSWKDHVNISCSNFSSEVTDTPVPTDATSQPSNQGLSLGIIIGIVAIIVILVGVLICVCLIRAWRKNKLPCKPLPSEQDTDEGAHNDNPEAIPMKSDTHEGAHDDKPEATPMKSDTDEGAHADKLEATQLIPDTDEGD